MHREFHRHAARVPNAVAYPLHRIEMHAIAGCEIATRLRDADDGLAAQQLVGGEPVVHEALEIERHEIDVRGVGEPVARAEAAFGGSEAMRDDALRSSGNIYANPEQSASQRLTSRARRSRVLSMPW